MQAHANAALTLKCTKWPSEITDNSRLFRNTSCDFTHYTQFHWATCFTPCWYSALQSCLLTDEAPKAGLWFFFIRDQRRVWANTWSRTTTQMLLKDVVLVRLSAIKQRHAFRIFFGKIKQQMKCEFVGYEQKKISFLGHEATNLSHTHRFFIWLTSDSLLIIKNKKKTTTHKGTVTNQKYIINTNSWIWWHGAFTVDWSHLCHLF